MKSVKSHDSIAFSIGLTKIRVIDWNASKSQKPKTMNCIEHALIPLRNCSAVGTKKKHDSSLTFVAVSIALLPAISNANTIQIHCKRKFKFRIESWSVLCGFNVWIRQCYVWKRHLKSLKWKHANKIYSTSQMKLVFIDIFASDPMHLALIKSWSIQVPGGRNINSS